MSIMTWIVVQAITTALGLGLGYSLAAWHDERQRSRKQKPRRCVGTCTEDTDPEGKPLGYCRGCYQDMEA